MEPWEGETSMEVRGKGTKIRVQTGLSAGHVCHLGEGAPEQARPRQGCLCRLCLASKASLAVWLAAGSPSTAKTCQVLRPVP